MHCRAMDKCRYRRRNRIERMFGTILSADITYDGIGSDGYESVGLALGLDMKS